MKKGCILIIGYIFSACSGTTSTLIMEYIVGHTIELISTLRYTLTLILCMHTIYQPRGPNQSLHYFYWTESSVHFNDFQPRGRRRINHGDMTSVIRVAQYFPA